MPLAEVHLENFIKAAHLKHSPLFTVSLKMKPFFQIYFIAEEGLGILCFWFTFLKEI